MNPILRKLRRGARMLGKYPAVTVISVLALALGVGLTTTMFSIVYGAVIRGLPFEESERITHLARLERGDDDDMEVPLHDYLDWREQQRVFDGLAAYYTGTVNVSGPEGPVRYDGAFITADAFRVLRVRPVLGRTFHADEDRPGAPLVVVLGYRAWQDRYGGDPEIVGRTIRANSEAATVVGVMPEAFRFPVAQEIWLPLRGDPVAVERGGGTTLEVVGRLLPGVTADEATAHMNDIARRLELEYPETNENIGVEVKPFTREYIGEEPIRLLYTMLGAVFLVLVIACANVANLLLSRAMMRVREVGIRSALGASRMRVVGQFLGESLALSAAGAVIGLGLAWIGVRLFNNAIAGTDPPFWIDIRIDPAALLFAVTVTLVAALLSGALPALQASRVKLSEILKDESRGGSSFRLGRVSRVLVVLEIALSFGLLVGAGLMIRTVVNVGTVDFPFATENVFTARVGLFEADYPDHESRARFFERLAARLETAPGVSAAGLTSGLPGGFAPTRRFALEGGSYAEDDDYPFARQVLVTPGVFHSVGVEPLEGRVFTDEDREGTLPVAIVNDRFAERFFPGESPVGQRIRPGASGSDEPWVTIVGVVPDLYHAGVEAIRPEAIYRPIGQSSARFMSIVARSRAGDPMTLTPDVRAAVTAIDPELPIYWIGSLERSIADQTWFFRVFGALFMVFGFTALALAAVGLYGVMSFSVSRRTREVGIRMALGAQRPDVLRLVFRQGMWQMGVGTVLGLLLALAVSRLLEFILFQVEPRDPVTFGAIAVTLVLTGVAACVIPARRATAVDPMAALRYE